MRISNASTLRPKNLNMKENYEEKNMIDPCFGNLEKILSRGSSSAISGALAAKGYQLLAIQRKNSQ